MKKLTGLTALLCILLLAGFQPSAELTEADSKAIEQAVLDAHAEMIAAAESKDADAMFDLIVNHDKDVIIQDGALIPTWQEAKDTIETGFGTVESVQYRFDRRRVNVLSPDIAVMTSAGATTVVTLSGQSFTTPFANTAVFILRDGRWKIVHGHHSVPNPR